MSGKRRGQFRSLIVTTGRGVGVAHGVELHQARPTVLAGERFTVGYALEEQAPADLARRAPDVDELRARFPTTTEATGRYFTSERTSDDLYPNITRLIPGLPLT